MKAIRNAMIEGSGGRIPQRNTGMLKALFPFFLLILVVGVSLFVIYGASDKAATDCILKEIEGVDCVVCGSAGRGSAVSCDWGKRAAQAIQRSMLEPRFTFAPIK